MDIQAQDYVRASRPEGFVSPGRLKKADRGRRTTHTEREIMGEIEHIRTILSRVFRDLERSWQEQKEEDFESKDQERTTVVNQD